MAMNITAYLAQKEMCKFKIYLSNIPCYKYLRLLGRQVEIDLEEGELSSLPNVWALLHSYCI